MVVLSVEILEKFDIINSYKGGEYMSHNQFIEKYNHISEEFILGGGYTGIELLQAIHIYLFEEECHAGKIRYEEKSSSKKTLADQIKNIWELNNKEISTTEYIKKVSLCIAIIYMYQPFYDGNSRTCLILQNILLKRKGMTLELSPKEEQMDKRLLAIIYHEQDNQITSTVERVKQQVKMIR